MKSMFLPGDHANMHRRGRRGPPYQKQIGGNAGRIWAICGKNSGNTRK